jgi:hypothetical protein
MASSLSGSRTPAFIPRQVLLPLIVVLGYVAFLITGIDATGNASLTDNPPVMLYIYFSLLLVLLQVAISENRSLGRLLYVFIASGFAIVYAGEAIFNAEGHKPGNFTRTAVTYIIINILLFVVFIYDAINRRRMRPGSLTASGADDASAPRVRRSPISYGSFATDFAGLAILCFIAAFLLDTLGQRTVLGWIGVKLGGAYVVVDLNQLFGLNLPAPISHLEGLDLGIGFAAAAVSLLLLVIVGALTLSGGENPAANLLRGEERFGNVLQRILSQAVDQTFLSLRLVLSPLIWLIPAFSIAGFTNNIANYLHISAHNGNSGILDLFNPFTATSLDNLPTLGTVLLLGAIAVGTVILSVAIVEHDSNVILHTLGIFRVAGRIAGLTLGFFLYSLAALNAGAVLFLGTKAEPFQVGTGGLLALLLGIGLAVYGYMRGERAAVRPAPEKVTTRV